MAEPRACPDCLRRSWLLALLGPYIEKIATGAPGSRSPELLRLSQRGPGRGRRRRRSPPSCWAGSRRLDEAHLAEELLAARLLGLLSPRRPLPGGAARRRRRALGADRARRPGPARRPRAVRRGDDRRRPPRHLLRARGRPRAGPGAGGGGDGRRQRPRLRHRRLRPPRRPRRRPHDRRARLRRRHRLPGGAPLALAADLRTGPGHLRVPARARRPGAGPSPPATGSWRRWPG